MVTGAGAVLNTARVRPGDTVAIIGAGGVGLNAVTAASLAGAAQIVAIDIHDDETAIGAIRSSLHAVQEEAADGVHRIILQPGERLNRDFILRFRLGSDSVLSALSVHPDPHGDGDAVDRAVIGAVPVLRPQP